jgi:hypothetical protein
MRQSEKDWIMQGMTIAVAAGAVLVLGCGPSATEVRQAKLAHYTCEYEQVFQTAVDVVKAEQPPVALADPREGVVASEFRWHDRHGGRKKAGAAMVGEGDMSFAVAVVIERRPRGWFVQAIPRVLAQMPDSPRGSELSREHANWPHWADAKADRVVLRIRQRLGECAVDDEA